jgi:hypothetical protein
VWESAGRAFKHVAKTDPGKTSELVYRMCHPGGSGAHRWLPLVKWTWPRAEWSHCITCIFRESTGRRMADNGVCRGLMQIHETHAAKFREVTGRSYWSGVFDPLANLRFGRWLWERNGWNPWVSMRGY